MDKYYEQTGYVGAEEPRCYYVPFASRDEWSEKREDSGEFLSLNGSWKIRAYDCPAQAEQDSFLDKVPEQDISVPSCVQYYGMDFFQYTNVNYPIPFDPPYVPSKNPTYHYSRYFETAKKGRQYMVFEGVDSCFYLYLNGKFVGFSQISHRVSEFDVTDYITEGKNKLDVLVLKWCAGTYLEDQDKLRFTGIFRDVYLLTRPERHVTDYKIETTAAGELTFKLVRGCDAEISFGGEKKKVSEGKEVRFYKKDAVLWSAETPALYDLDIETEGEFIRERVGFREILIKDGVFLLNGKPIKLRGVNRHDFHPEKGAAVSLDDIMTDLRLMKHLNVNAIRTSHYPSCPELYLLCDKYGIYVLDEADLETHGCSSSFPGRTEGVIPDMPEFEQAMVDRQRMLVERDKNRPCVLIWSMGNECGWGRNFYACADYIHRADATRPVHYERITRKDWKEETKTLEPDHKEYYGAPVDIVSRMYASPEFMRDHFLSDESEKRPFVQCEYCHAMGNGPGDFKDYWDVIYSSDRFMGGFVWEWADHGVLYGTKGFRYGGDFGETLHDGNFCIDGIVAPDRAIKTGTLEMKKAYEPVAITLEDGFIAVKSRNYFADMAFEAEITYKNFDGTTKTVKTDMAVAPGETVTYPVDAPDARFIGVSLKTVADEGLVEKGYEFAKEGFFAAEDPREPLTPCAVEIKRTPTTLYVTAGANGYEIDAGTGEIMKVTHCGKNVFADKIALNVYRAPTDNDRGIVVSWHEQRLHLSWQDAYSVEVTAPDRITVKGKIASEKLIPSVLFTLTYTFCAEGVKTQIDYKYTPLHDGVFLPRIGLATKLAADWQNVEFYGYGPQESYIDKRFACVKDRFKTTVKDSFNHYIKPQENGSHYGTQYAEITDGKTTVRLQNADGFSFCASPYSACTLEKTKHDDELPASDAVYLYADYYMSGIGSNSCGPRLNERYRTPDCGKGEIDIIIK